MTARTHEHKCKFDKNTARTTECHENLSLIPPGTVSVIGNLSRIPSGLVSIKENCGRTARTYEYKCKFNKNATKTS